MTEYNSKSRRENSIINVSTSLLTQILTMILELVVRTVFLKILGEALLGVSGLFSNILMLLNLAELGIHNAIIFALYKPVATNNIDMVNRILSFYKKCYHIIALVIAVVGCSLTPFVRSLINYEGTLEHIEIYYLLYVFQTVSTYLFSYRTILLNATQNQHIISKVNLYTKIIISVLQILAIILFKNYYAYLLLYISGSILSNVIASVIAAKKYPQSFSFRSENELSNSEKKSMFSDIKALMLYKIGGVISNGTDNIIISKFVGIIYVARYYNYYGIIVAIRNLLISCINSITSSIGNLNVQNDKGKTLSVYYTVNFISFLAFGFFSVGFYSAADCFVTMWIGKEYLLPKAALLAITLNFYVYGLDNVSIIFRNTLGIFRIGKYRPLIGAAINLVLSIILAKNYGIAGVIFATVISKVLTTVWYDPYLIIKKGLEASPIKYYLTYILNLIILVITFIATDVFKSLLILPSLAGFFVYGFFSVSFFCSISLLAYYKRSEFYEIKGLIVRFWKYFFRRLRK